MHAKSRIVAITTSENEPSEDAQFPRWWNEELRPRLGQIPRQLGLRRYEAIQGEPRSMVWRELAAEGIVRPDTPDEAKNTSATNAAEGRASMAPQADVARESRSGAVLPGVGFQTAIYKQLSPEKGLLQGSAWAENAEERGLLVVRLDVASERAEEFEEWYATEHLPALCAVPGVIGGRTFAAVVGQPRYMAVYHLTDPAVQASPAWERAAATPWTMRMRRLIPQRWRVVYRPRLEST